MKISYQFTASLADLQEALHFSMPDKSVSFLM